MRHRHSFIADLGQTLRHPFALPAMLTFGGLLCLGACSGLPIDPKVDQDTSELTTPNHSPQSQQAGASPEPGDSGENKSVGKANINDVPKRPRLTYTIQQRRKIEEGLIGDREVADYARTSGSRPAVQRVTLAPPPVSDPNQDNTGATTTSVIPETIEPEAQTDTIGAPPVLAAADDVEPQTFQSGSVIEASGDGLNDFLKDIRRLFVDPIEEFVSPAPDVVAPRADLPDAQGNIAMAKPEEGTIAPISSAPKLVVDSNSAADEDDGEVIELSSATIFSTTTSGSPVTQSFTGNTPVPTGEDLDRFSKFISDQVGIDVGSVPIAGNQVDVAELHAIEPSAGKSTEATTEPERAAPTPGIAIAEFLFAPAEKSLNQPQTNAIQAVMQQYDLSNHRLIAIGNAEKPALALNRARELARAIVAAGFPSDRIEIRAETGSDVVLIQAETL